MFTGVFKNYKKSMRSYRRNSTFSALLVWLSVEQCNIHCPFSYCSKSHIRWVTGYILGLYIGCTCFPLTTRKHMLGRTSAICLFKNTPQIFANNLKKAPKPLTIISTKGETYARVYSTICVGNKRDKIKNAYDTTR